MRTHMEQEKTMPRGWHRLHDERGSALLSCLILLGIMSIIRLGSSGGH